MQGDALINTQTDTQTDAQSNTQLTATSGFDGLLFDPIPPETRKRLLRFALGEQDSVLLPLEQVTEILSVDFSEVLPVPEMPRSVIGICNWRGAMLWLIDLNHFVGYPSPLHQEQTTPLNIIVIQSGQHSVGIAVLHINEIELHDLERLQPPPIGLFSLELLPLIRGMLPGCNDVVIDFQPLIHCPLWKKHPKGEA